MDELWLLHTFASHMKARSISIAVSFKAKAKDYAQLTKLRLASLVVFSALTGYFFALDLNEVVFADIFYLIVGGFLITGSSNAFNQIIEKDFDKLMKRTEDRPIPDGRLSSGESFWLACGLGITGAAMLWFGLNPLSGLLGTLALFLYVAVYTPLKRVGPIAVFAGAFPGAIPPMLGYVAATNDFGLIPGVLFATQFIWQFPHFWAIAWKANDDYTKAGFRLMPSASGKSKTSAFYILIYSIFLIPISLFPVVFTSANGWLMAVIAALGIGFAWFSMKLFFDLSEKSALKLMLASFVYLPIVQLLYLI